VNSANFEVKFISFLTLVLAHDLHKIWLQFMCKLTAAFVLAIVQMKQNAESNISRELIDFSAYQNLDSKENCFEKIREGALTQFEIQATVIFKYRLNESFSSVMLIVILPRDLRDFFYCCSPEMQSHELDKNKTQARDFFLINIHKDFQWIFIKTCCPLFKEYRHLL
jgi:hypothetical protein